MQDASLKTKVLVVDDEEMILEIISDALKVLGFEVKTAPNGRAAKAMLDQNPSQFDIVISDLRMPELDGVTLLKHSKATFPRTKFIAMTGYSDTNPDRVIELGADEFVAKPFVIANFTDLIHRVKATIGGDEGFEVI